MLGHRSSISMVRSRNADGEHPYYSQYDEAQLEGAKFRLVLTRTLKLMSSTSKYNRIFRPDVDVHEYDSVDIEFNDIYDRKQALYLLEVSCPKSHREGDFTLENIMFTNQQDIRRGRFTPLPGKKPEKQIFDKYHAGPEDYPLLRQRSDEDKKMQQFQVACRKVTDRTIAALFIVFPKTVELAIPSIVNLKVYEQ